MRAKILLGLTAALLLTAVAAAQGPGRHGPASWRRPGPPGDESRDKRRSEWVERFRKWREERQKAGHHRPLLSRFRDSGSRFGQWADRFPRWREACRRTADRRDARGPRTPQRHGPLSTRFRDHHRSPGDRADRFRKWREEAMERGRDRRPGPGHERAPIAAVLKELHEIRREIQALREEISQLKKSLPDRPRPPQQSRSSRGHESRGPSRPRR